ncbi:MAG: GNAT family N-acetyltransferase [Eubacteriales bacterium]|nr:GNAT family N-acetyltransferase [Eubacteriales bacterium]
MNYRMITPRDNATIAKIVRDNLKAYHLDVPGTVYYDESLDHLSDFYLADPKRRAYYIVIDEQEENKVIGGIGFAEFDGKENCAELQKLYLANRAKGRGLGYELIRLVEQKVRELGYQTLYLETHTNLEPAIHIYEKYGFTKIERPGGVVHGTMNRFYELKLHDA